MAGNNYTLSLSAQVSTAGLQAQLDAWAKEYVLKLNAAIQNTQASGGGGAGGGVGACFGALRSALRSATSSASLAFSDTFFLSSAMISP